MTKMRNNFGRIVKDDVLYSCVRIDRVDVKKICIAWQRLWNLWIMENLVRIVKDDEVHTW